jgi:hypothetical protein
MACGIFDADLFPVNNPKMGEPTQVRLKLLEESNNRRLANTKILGIKN